MSTLFRALLEHLPNPKMATIQVLDNPTIHNLLINLSKEETTSFRDTIEQTLEAFSINGERQYQPPPSIVNRPNGQNTLFRQFTSDSCIGTKITVEPAPAPGPGPDGQSHGRKDPLHGVIVRLRSGLMGLLLGFRGRIGVVGGLDALFTMSTLLLWTLSGGSRVV